jgi:glycosyltransferase involved in cell wall biosynthesis
MTPPADTGGSTAGRRPVLYINGRFLAQRLTGVQRTAGELVRALDRLMAEDVDLRRTFSAVLLAPPDATLEMPLSCVKYRQAGRFKGHIWEQLELPVLASGGFLLSLCNLGPVLHRNQAVLIHDAQVYALPGNYSRTFRWYYKFVQPLLGRRAKLVLTVSEFSRRQITAYGIAPASKIRVLHNGADHILSEPADGLVLEKHSLRTGRFILAVGSLTRNKNLGMVLKAFQELQDEELTLVLAGISRSSLFADTALEQELRHACLVGGPSDAQLRALYEQAFCLVFPSYYEGFGLPAVEAMLCGCPVIASDSAALPEVCRDGALYCAPDDLAGLVSALRSLRTHPEQAAHLAVRGREIASTYTWRECAGKLVGYLRDFLHDGGH